MSYRSKYTGVEVEAALDKAKTAVLPDALDKKQDVIEDLDNIRSNASKGSTAVQPEELASVATSGSYNDLKNKPYIPNEVTEQTVGDWGYTKNKGDYSKPSTGIPKSDLSYNVQQSLNKADSALQYHQDISHLATKKSLESKVDKVSGKQLSTEDFTTALKNKLNKLSNYDDTAINNTINKLRSDFDTLVSGDTTAAIKTFNEVIAFLDGISDSEDLDSIIASIEQQIATKYSKPNNGIPKSDLANNIQLSLDKADTALQEHQDIAHLATKDELNTKLDTIEDLTAIREGAALGATALQEEQYKGTYSKPNTGIPSTDLSTDVQHTLNKANSALLEETYKGTVSAVDTEDSLDEPEAADIREKLNELSETVTKKADEEGYYPKLSVGLADNLLGHAPLVERTIVFDATASKNNDVTDDVARIESIKGNSIVWNQTFKTDFNLTSGGVTIVSANSVITINGTLTLGYFNINNQNILLKTNNIGLFVCEVIKDENNQLEGKTFSLFNRSVLGKITNGFAYGAYLESNVSLGWGFGFTGLTEGDVLDDIQVIVSVYDLTQMFGAGNEPSTIEEFYSLVPKGVNIHEYNKGEVIHNNASGLKSVGFNAWDEEWVNGYYTKTGFYKSETYVALKNPIKVIAGQEYRFSILGDAGYFYVAHYDKNDNYIDVKSVDAHGRIAIINHSTYKIPEGVYYIRVFMSKEYGTVYKNDICIHLAHTGYRNGEYEKYWQETISLPNTLAFPNGMKSAGTAYDEIYYDEHTKKWRVVKRIGEVDLGTLNWNYNASYGFFVSLRESPKWHTDNFIFELFYDKLITPTHKQLAGLDKVAVLGVPNIETSWNKVLVIKDTKYSDITTFKNAMLGVMFYYELAEPIELDLEEYLPSTMLTEERAKILQLLYRVSDFGTEEMLIDEGVKSTALIADILYGVDSYRTIVNLRNRFAEVDFSDYATKDELNNKAEASIESSNDGTVKITINGVSKNFIPSTPSGDVFHYMYVGHGAKYNEGEDYILEPEWANLADDVEYNAKYGLNKITGTKVKVITYQGVDYDIYEQDHYTLGSAFKVWVVGIKSQNGTLIWDDSKIIHRKGRWLFNCIGDLTNDQMRDIVNQTVRYATTPFCYAYMGSQYSEYKGRTNMPSYGGNIEIQNHNLRYTFYHALYENALMGTSLNSESVFKTNHSDFLGGQIRHLTGAQIKASANSITFKGSRLSTIKFCNADKSFSVASSMISKNSILQAIETEKATSVITIGLHSSAFNRINNEPDIVEALNNHPNVTLATI